MYPYLPPVLAQPLGTGWRKSTQATSDVVLRRGGQQLAAYLLTHPHAWRLLEIFPLYFLNLCPRLVFSVCLSASTS